MGNARTNSLHELLDVELRAKVERDLVEQPPGRATYRQVWEHHELGEQGISLRAVERYGGYLRTLKRNQWISEVADSMVGQDLAPNIAGLMRSRLFEALTCEETKLGDLLKAALSAKAITEAEIKLRDLEERDRKMSEALARTAKTQDPEKALHDLREDIQLIYGVGGGK